MVSNPHRSSAPRRFLVWVVGVVITGRVINSPTEYELRQLSRAQIAASFGAFGASMALFSWVAFVMHSGIRAAILGYAVIAVGAASIPFVVRACVAHILRYAEGRMRDSPVDSANSVSTDARTKF